MVVKEAIYVLSLVESRDLLLYKFLKKGLVGYSFTAGKNFQYNSDQCGNEKLHDNYFPKTLYRGQ